LWRFNAKIELIFTFIYKSASLKEAAETVKTISAANNLMKYF